ncbi:hypothetical protein Tco_0995666 [Tanacetum coccineum]
MVHQVQDVLYLYVKEKNNKSMMSRLGVCYHGSPNELITFFIQYPDVSSMFCAIETRFGGVIKHHEARKSSDSENTRQYLEGKETGARSKTPPSKRIRAATYKRGLATVEAQLITYRKNEVLFSEEVAVLKREVACKDYEINVLKIPPPHPLIYNRPKSFDLSYSGLDKFKSSELEFKEADTKSSNGLGPKASNFLILYVHGKPQYDDKGFVDSGCSRHMTGNIAYLSDFMEIDGGYVAFRWRWHYMREKGIKREYSVARTPQQNVTADTSYFDSPTKDVDNGKPKTADDAQKQVEDGPNNENAEQDKFADDSSTKDVNAAGQHINTASPDVNTGSLKLNVVGPSVNTA